MNCSRKKNQKRSSGKFRRTAVLLMAMGGLFGVANSAFGETVRVSSYSALCSAIQNFNAGTTKNTVVEIDGTIKLTGEIPAILGNGDYSLTVNGVNGGTIDGGGTTRGFYVDTDGTNSSVEINGLAFSNCVATGGDGGSGLSTGGGGLGAGGAIYAKSGDLKLVDVTFVGNQAVGGSGGYVLPKSEAYGAGGGLSGDGGGDSVSAPSSTLVVGDGGGAGYGIGAGNNAGLTSNTVSAGDGGGVSYEEGKAPEGWDMSPHTENGVSGLVGGDGGYGGGGAASAYIGGDGGDGGGGGAGLVAGGSGGFGGGGAGGSDQNSGGTGGFAAGNGGYQNDLSATVTGGGVGGGGAGLGGALFVEEGANVSIVYSSVSTVFSGNGAKGGQAGTIYGTNDYSGNAQDGEGIGDAIFLKDDLTLDVQNGAQVIVKNNIGGFAGATLNADAYKDSSQGGIVKNGTGTLVLDVEDKSASTYAGNTTINEGKLIAASKNAVSQYSSLVVNNGTMQLNADQSVENLYGDSSRGSVVLNGHNLTVSQGSEDGSTVYRGTIIDATGNGSLVKDGDGTLRIASDNRGTTVNVGSASSVANIFKTKILGGTVQLDHSGALGDGTVVFAQTKYNKDEANSLQLGGSAFDSAGNAEIANDLSLSGTEPMRIGVASDAPTNANVELSGQITVDSANSNATGVLQANMNAADQILSISNTGIDSDTKKRAAAKANDFKEMQLNRGTLQVLAERETGTYNEETEKWSGSLAWFNSLGNATVTNLNDGNALQIVGNANGYEEASPVVFRNDLSLNAGLLAIQNDAQDLKFSGKISGSGGLLVDLSETTDVLKLTGTVAYSGETRIKSGILDVSSANGSATGSVNLGGLSTAIDAENAAVVAGNKTLVVESASDYSYSGVITNSLTDLDGGNKVAINKKGSGVWTLELERNGELGWSNVGNIAVNGGYLGLNSANGLNQKTLGDGSVVDAVVVKLNEGGGLKVLDGENVTLDSLDATTANSFIVVGDESSLTLSGLNATTKIRSGFSGTGTVFFNNVFEEIPATEEGGEATTSLKPWQLSGYNANWEGIFQTADNGELQLTSSKAVGTKSTINLAKDAKLNVFLDNDLGKLVLSENGTVNVAQGKTLSIAQLNGSEQLSITGTGTVALEAGAASFLAGKSGGFDGTTKITGATLLVKGDNQVNVGTRGETWLKNAGILEMNYEGLTLPESGTFGTLWGTESVNVENSGGITISGTSQNVLLSNTINLIPSDGGVNYFQIDSGNATVTFDGAIVGDGVLNKVGAGTLVLDGSDKFGSALINEGTLRLGADRLNEQLAEADVKIASGTRLTGTANSFNSLNVSGNLSLNGSSATTLTADSGTDAFVMNGGSVVDLNVQDAENYTRFETTDGNVALNGGTFNVVMNDDLDEGSTLTIFKTENGNLTADLNKLYVLDNVVGKRFVMNTETDRQFDLIWQKTRYTDGVFSQNGWNVGDALTRWADDRVLSEETSRFFNALENEQTRNPNVVEQFSGEIRYSAMNAQMLNRAQIRQTVSQKLFPRPTSLGYSAIRGQANDGIGLAGWTSVYGTTGDVDSNHRTSGFDYNLFGGVFGVELGSNETQQFGLFYSYGNSEVESGTNIGSVDLNENIFGTYFRWNDPLGYGLVLGSFGVTDYKTNRSFNVGNYAGGFQSEQDGWSGNVYLERGYTFELPRVNLQPYGGLQYTFIHQDEFGESGWRGLSLNGSDSDYDSLQSVLGLRMNREMLLQGRSLDASIYMNWTHEFLETTADGYAAFSGNPNVPFRVVGNSIGRDYAMFGGGGNWTVNERLDVFGSCDLQMNEYVQTIGGNAGAQFRW